LRSRLMVLKLKFIVRAILRWVSPSDWLKTQPFLP